MPDGERLDMLAWTRVSENNVARTLAVGDSVGSAALTVGGAVASVG